MQRKGAVIVEAAFVMPFAIAMLFYLVVAFLYFHDFYVMQSVTQQTARNIAVDAGSNIQTNAQTGIVYSEPQVVLEKYKKELNSLILYEVDDASKISLKLEGDFIKNDAKVQAGKPYSTMSVKGAYVVLTSEVKRRGFIGEISFPVCPETLYVQRKTRVELAMDTKLLYANNTAEEDVTITMRTKGSDLVLSDSNNTYTLVLNDATDAFYKDYEMKWILKDKDGNIISEAEYWYNMSAFENPDNDLYRKTTADGEYYDFEVKRKDGFEMEQAEQNVLLNRLKDHFVKSTVAVEGNNIVGKNLLNNEYYSLMAATDKATQDVVFESDIVIRYNITNSAGKNVTWTEANTWIPITDLADGILQKVVTQNGDITINYEYQHSDGSNLTDEEKNKVKDFLANTRLMNTDSTGNYGTAKDLLILDGSYDMQYVSVNTDNVITLDNGNEYNLRELDIKWNVYNSLTDTAVRINDTVSYSEKDSKFNDFALKKNGNYKFVRFNVENGENTNYTKAELALIAEHLANSVSTEKFVNNVQTEFDSSSIYYLSYDAIKQKLNESGLNIEDYVIKYDIKTAENTNFANVYDTNGNRKGDWNNKTLSDDISTYVIKTTSGNDCQLRFQDIKYKSNNQNVSPTELASIFKALQSVELEKIDNKGNSATIISTQGCTVSLADDIEVDGSVIINDHTYDLSKYKISWSIYDVENASYPISSGPLTKTGDIYNVPSGEYNIKINVIPNGVALTPTALADLESYYTSKVSLSNSGTKNDKVVTSSDQVVIGVRHNDSGWKNTGLDNTASDGNYVTTKPTFITAGESYKVDLDSFDLDKYKVYVYVAGLKPNGEWENVYKLENIDGSKDMSTTKGGMIYSTEDNICTFDLTNEAVKYEKNDTNKVYNGYAVFYNVQAQDNKSTYAISKLPTDEEKIAVIADKITLSVLQ